MDEKDLEYFGYPRPMNEAELIGSALEKLKAPIDLVSDFTPGLGDAKSAGLAIDDLINDDYGSAALNAIGILPFVPSLGSVIRGSRHADELMRLAENLHMEEARKRAEEIAGLLYDADEIPPGWYVHGRGGRQTLRDDAPIQMTQNWDIANQYGRDGSMYLLQPNPKAHQYDFTSPATEDMKQVASEAIRGLGSNGNISTIIDDIAGTKGRTYQEITPRLIKEGIQEAFAPKDIVGSAGAFDNFEWTEWLASISPNDWETFVKTPDGAVALDPLATRYVKVPRKAIW